MKKRKIYPLYMDIVAKHIFGYQKRAKYLADILEAMFNLERGSLKGIKIKNSVKLDKNVVFEKGFETDIIVELPNKEIFNIEFYSNYDENAEIKSFMYISKIFSSDLKVNDNYNLTHKVTQINFVKKDGVHEDRENLIRKYLVINEDNKKDMILPELFQVYIVDVDLSKKKCYHVNERFLKWMQFIGAETKEEMEKIIKGSEIMAEVYDEMKNFSNENWVTGYFHPYRLYRSQLNSEFEEKFEKEIEKEKEKSFEQGIGQGIMQGKNETFTEIAKRMLKDNVDVKTIQKYTDLTLEQIQELQDKIV